MGRGSVPVASRASPLPASVRFDLVLPGSMQDDKCADSNLSTVETLFLLFVRVQCQDDIHPPTNVRFVLSLNEVYKP